MTGDSGDSSSDFSEKPSCSRRITRRSKNAAASCSISSNTGGKKKRRIVMRIEFDDDSEESTSATSGSDADDGNKNTKSTNNYVVDDECDDDDDDIKPCSSRKVRGKVGKNKKDFAFSSSDGDNNSEDDDLPVGSIRRRHHRNFRRNRQILEDDDDDEENDDAPAEGSSNGREIAQSTSRNLKNNIINESEDEPVNVAPSASLENRYDENGFNSDSSSNELLEKCPICLLTFRTQQIGSPATCEHIFCANCIEAWSKNVQTCPIDRIEFDRIIVRESYENRELVREINVCKTNGAEKLDQDVNDEDVTHCEVCNRPDREEVMLLCDSCNQGYHIDCLSPPLEEIPEGSWYCDNCFDSENGDDSDMAEDLNELYEDIRDMGIPETRYRVTEVHQPRILRTRQNERIRAAILSRTRSSARLMNRDDASSSSRHASTSRSARTVRNSTRTARTSKTGRRRKRRPRQRTYVVEYDLNNFDEKFAIKTTKRVIKRRRRKRTRRTRRTSAQVENSSNKRMTASRRMAEQMGVKSTDREARAAASAQSFSLFGNANDLEYFSDSDDGGRVQNEIEIETGGGTAVQTSVRISNFRTHRSKKGLLSRLERAPPPSTPDLLSNIMDLQDRWHNASRHMDAVRIGQDGSLNLPPPSAAVVPNPTVSTPNATDSQTSSAVNTNSITQAPMYPRGGGGNNRNFNSGGGGGSGGNAGSSGNYNNRYNNQSNYRGGGASTGAGNSGSGQYRSSFGSTSSSSGIVGGNLFNMVGRGNFSFSSQTTAQNQDNDNNTPNNNSNNRDRFNQRNNNNNNNRNNNRRSLPHFNNSQSNENLSSLNMSQPPPQQHQPPTQQLPPPPQCPILPVQPVSNILQSSFPPPPIQQRSPMPMPPPVGLFNNLPPTTAPPPMFGPANLPLPMLSQPPPIIPMCQPALGPTPAPVSSVVPPLVAPPTFNSSLFQLTADYGNDDDDDSNCPNFSVYSMESLQVAKSDVKSAAASKSDTPKEDDENEDLVQLSDDDEMIGNLSDEIPLPPSDKDKTNTTTNDSAKKESELYEPDEPTLESDDESVDQNKDQSNDEHDDGDTESHPSPENDMDLDSQDAAENVVADRASLETSHNHDDESGNEKENDTEESSKKHNEADDKDERISLSDIRLPEDTPTPAASLLPTSKQSHRKGVLELYDDSDWEELNMEKPTAEDYRANTPPLVAAKSSDNSKTDIHDEEVNEKDDDDDEVVEGQISDDDKIDEPATPPTVPHGEKHSSDAEKECEEIDGKEQDRSYTPCLDEKNDNVDEETEDGACTPELIRPSATSDNLNDAGKDANTSSDHGGGAADTSGIGGMETELISEEDDADKREKNRRAREAKNKEQFKKVSKSTKDRNYRGEKPQHENKFREKRPRRSRSRSNDKENQGLQFRRFQRGRFRRRELPRYNVRNVVNQQRSFKDRYGRDESRPPRSLSRNRRRRSFSKSNSRSKSRSKSGSQSSSPKRARRSFSISPTPPRFNANRRQSMSPRRRSHSPAYRSPMRRQSRTPLRMRSRSNSPVRRVNKNPNNKFKRPPPGKRSLTPPPNRARSMSRFTPRLSRSRTPPRHKTKKTKDRKKKKAKKRQGGSKPGKSHGRSPSRGGSAPPPSKRKRRRTPKAKSPGGDQGWSPSPSPPRNYMQYENVSWTPPLMSPAGVSRLRRNDEYNEFSIPSKPPKKKRDKKKKKSEKRRTEITRNKDKRRREGTAPSKEVFASGNNILVSVSFNKDANQPQQTTVVTMPPTREEVLGNRPRSSERQITLERRKKKNTRKRKKLDTKPVAIIDLERSPFQVTQEQADVIVLTDSEGGGHDEENLNVSRESANDMMTEMEHHHQREGSSHRTVNSDKTPPLERLEAIMEESYENAIQQQGPKTPPEPPSGIKFNLLNKNKQKVTRNVLHDEAELEFDEQQDEQDQEEREPMPQNTNKIGPNTPPDSGPCSPDVYDPFDPTKSPSMSPRSPTPPPDLSHDSVQDNDVPPKHSTEDLRTEPRMPTSSGPIATEKPTLNPVDLVMALMNSKTSAAQDLNNKPNESQYNTGSTIVNLIDENDKPEENNSSTGITVLSNVILSSGKSQHIPIISSPPLSKASSQMHKPPSKLTNILSGLPGISNRHNGVGLDDLVVNDIESPYSPGSADYEDLFEPPPDANGTKGRRNKRPNKTADIFENLFGSSSPPPISGHLRIPSSRKQKAAHARNKHKTIVKVTKLPDDHVKVYDDLPNSAVELQVKDKFLRKLNRQERVVEEVKMILKPKFNRKQITKDDYKEIMRRAVPKICHSKSGDINPKKIQNLIEAYVKKFRQKHKKLNIPNTGQVSSAVKCAAYLKKL